MIPPKANAAFVCSMEDVLEVYTRPYDSKRPQVCMDDKLLPLIVHPATIAAAPRRGRSTA